MQSVKEMITKMLAVQRLFQMQPRRKKRWEVIDIDNEDDNTNESRKKKRKVSLSPQGNTNSNNVASAVIFLYVSSACDNRMVPPKEGWKAFEERALPVPKLTWQ